MLHILYIGAIYMCANIFLKTKLNHLMYNGNNLSNKKWDIR